MLKDNLTTTKSINEMLMKLITIRDPRTAALRDAQVSNGLMCIW